ncbi:MAG: FecR domain-containing protein [Sedimentisphaerales bacterium]|nr:FecR domain-containing protein [Sedimentisphaerales bacterium]
MSHSSAPNMELCELVIDLVDGSISPERFERLDQILYHNVELQKYYVELITICGGLKQRGIDIRTALDSTCSLDPSDTVFWEIIEKDLAAREASRKDENSIVADEVRRSIYKRPTRKSVYSFLTKAAVFVLFFLVLVYMDSLLKQERSKPEVVATVAESINAKWGNMEIPYEEGNWLYADDKPLWLQEGLVKVKFEHGTEVILEAPCEFNFLSSSKMKLKQGRLCAKVTPKGHGFTVEAPGCSIVDLGTEFGVIASAEGLSEAHVLDGQVELWELKPYGRSQTPYHLQKGQMSTFTREGNIHIGSKPAQPMAFIRQMPQENMAYVPARVLDLADIVGGGNGFGAGIPDAGIDLLTGARRDTLDDIHLKTSQQFVHTSEFSFVDGVFIPGIGNHPTQIASTGLTFDQFPLTSGYFWGYISNGAWHKGDGVPYHRLVLDGRRLDSDSVSALTIHPNLGITFNLEQIRRTYPALMPVRFHARAGLSQTIAQFTKVDPVSEFWILADNEVRLRKLIRMSDGGFDIEVPLELSDGFISLAVTDGDGDISFNWAVFVNPKLDLDVRH